MFFSTRAFNPRLVRNEYSTNPATIEYDNSQNCEFVYRFIQHEKTIRDELDMPLVLLLHLPLLTFVFKRTYVHFKK
ncbi:hypothetical protein OESDEN_08640 [Oesophagostomum dentatum]|uniref:Uncharacterized protein n=1 Tax=Oesophagostomum dentatum TaxID=61180 RepID=A0A0B1T5S0_OESDE|nr:hypothetical protein OESDEN_08640 [Oesophagostomum dentatum]